MALGWPKEELVTMTGGQVFTSRLKNRPLLDGEGLTIGRIRDVVILPAAGNDPPRALGLVVTFHRRRIFVNLGRIAEISVDGAHLHGATVDLERFTRRLGEVLRPSCTDGTSRTRSWSTSPSDPASSRDSAGKSARSPSRTDCGSAARRSSPGTSTRNSSRPGP